MMRRILAIDPGPETSGVVLLTEDTPPIIVSSHDSMDNKELEDELAHPMGVVGVDTKDITVVIEMIASYGMPVGADVFETCVWIGRFMRSVSFVNHKTPVHRIERIRVKNAICHNSSAKDSNIRRAILDMYPPTGGGKTPQVGTKPKPGPLYGVSNDAWAALAVGLTFLAES